MASRVTPWFDRTAAARAAGGARPVRSGQAWLVANACFAALLLAVLVGVTPFQEWVMEGENGKGDLLNQLLHLGIVTILFFASGTTLTRRQLLPLPFSFVLLFALCALSILWSIDPLISMRRLALTVIVCWVIFRCIGELGYARTLLIIRYALIALTVVNFLVVFYTDYGVHPELIGEESSVVGNWRGILPHKNIAGATCAFTVLFLTFDVKQVPRWLAWATIAASLVFLFYSQSRTSEGVLAFSLLCGWLIRPYSANYRTVLALALVIVAGLAVQIVSGYIDAIQTFLNDPGSLTGRAAIWPLLLEYAADHPWTGAGFGAFWQIGDKSPIWLLTDSWVAHFAGHGHNGYLDLLVTIGIPGLVAAVLTLLLWPLARLLLSLSISKPSRSLLLSVLVFCAGHNLSESSLLNGSAAVQVFLVITVALIYYQSNNSAGAHHLLRGRALKALRRAGARRPASA
jgi:O-antigen ligase